MRFHIHIYKVSGKAEINVDADNPAEAKSIALSQRDDLEYGQSECNYIALEFDENDPSVLRSR